MKLIILMNIYDNDLHVSLPYTLNSYTLDFNFIIDPVNMNNYLLLPICRQAAISRPTFRDRLFSFFTFFPPIYFLLPMQFSGAGCIYLAPVMPVMPFSDTLHCLSV